MMATLPYNEDEAIGRVRALSADERSLYRDFITSTEIFAQQACRYFNRSRNPWPVYSASTTHKW